MPGGKRRGLTLFEALVALTLLALGAAAWTGLVAQGVQSVRHAHIRDAATQNAAAAMTLVSLWPRNQLLAHVGVRPLNGHTVRITRVGRDLFDVTVLDASGNSALLSTTVYARDSVSTR